MAKTLDDVLKELCDYYVGDVISPGIQVAYLPESQEFYAAVHQFPSSVASRKIIAKAKAPTSGLAMALCMNIWRDMTRVHNPQPGQDSVSDKG